MTLTDNPLLQAGELPAFAAIRPEHVKPAIDLLLAEAETALERAVGPEVPADHDVLALVLDVPVERLRRSWAHVNHLQAVADTPALRAAHAEALPRLTDFTTRLGADARLYAKYKAVAASPAAAAMTPAQKKALADTLRDFVLGGAELQGAQRERYAAIQERCSLLSKAFGDHVLDATDAFTLDVDEALLVGVPDDVRQAARDTAAAAGVAGCRLTLQAPCYVPLLQYASHRALREQLFRAYTTRASELGPAALDNSAVMQELLALRAEEAALLGHASFAHLALVPKMARTPDEVLGFVRDLARRARPAAERELAELREYAARELGLPDMQAWDRPYVAEKLKHARYDFSSQEVKQYFTEPAVLQGLFGLIETLFEVAIRPGDAPVWHDSVRYFRVWRGDKPVAAFYLDPYARPGKQSGAWMDDSRGRWRRPEGGLQLPVAHLVCNFAPPVGGQPALLTHDEVITLFHEFGHGLHHMLTQVDELGVSGISGVEWDAVELPSQFMENFCWEWEVLQRLTRHVHTGRALPRELFDRMTAARHFGSGLGWLRQCEFGLLDMRLHAEAATAGRVQAIGDEVNAEIQPVRAPGFVRYPHSFGHIFDGGYAAGYYGYAWAEVLSADAYGAFEEAGVYDVATGRRFREHVLEVGGSRPAIESFRAFRGREPQLDALLRHQGLA
ncbi:MAG: M3 family metallopeptidase [Rubrivivax sp.]|nr:M3 family metallopeptidase [Rubrivivax sp.]